MQAAGRDRLESNALLTVMVMYLLFMSGAITLVVWGFRGRIDLSGRLFVTGELLRLLVIVLVVAAHLSSDFKNASTYFITNTAFVSSEAAFAYSIFVLSRGRASPSFLPFVGGLLLICVVLELVRVNHPQIPILAYPITHAILSLTSAFICSYRDNLALTRTAFWKILRAIEVLFFILASLRVISFAAGVGVTPFTPTFSSVLFFTLMLVLLVFRYLAYQAIWMTLADPNVPKNRFNENLITAIGERNELEQKLSISNRRIGVSILATSLAHQLSQPLTGAALEADAVKRKVMRSGGDAEMIQGIEKVSHLLTNLSGLVHHLRAHFATDENQREPIDIVQICNEVIELAERSEKAAGVAFHRSGHAYGLVLGNRIQIQQVIINIVDNALDAMAAAANKSLDISFAELQDKVCVSIRDHGIGISPQTLATLFEPYQTTKPNGVGIGLWLCKSIIEKHKGAITVTNHPSGGALVRLEFPVVRSAA